MQWLEMQQLQVFVSCWCAEVVRAAAGRQVDR